MADFAPVPPAVGLTKALSLVIIVLILAAAGYAAWIAVVNWNAIGV